MERAENLQWNTFPITPCVCLRATFGNFKVQICRKSGRKCKQKCQNEVEAVKFPQ